MGEIGTIVEDSGGEVGRCGGGVRESALSGVPHSEEEGVSSGDESRGE